MTRTDRGNKGSDRRNGAVILANTARAAPLLLCLLAGCWESGGQGGAGSDTGADGGTDQQTDSLYGWLCTNLSPCVESDVSGYTCPGFATDVKCWNLGSKCDAVFLCATASQACEIVCGATACEESGATPPQPLCD